MANTATQNDSINNGKTDKAANTAGSIAPGSHPTASVSFVSGTAKQLSSKNDLALYINVTTSASLKVELGPTAASLVTINAAESDALGLLTLIVPASWYVNLTGTMADVACTQVIL